MNLLLLRITYYCSVVFKTVVQKGKPAFISIEPTTLCNLHCPECFTSQPSFTRPKGSMDLETFERIITETEKYGFYMNLYFQGEPFMNPGLNDFISRAKQSGFYVAVSTNGHFIDETTAEKLIINKLDRLIISLDGTDAETYNKYRHSGSFEQVVSGIKTIVSAKQKMKSHSPFLELQFLLTRKNQSQKQEIKHFGKDLGVDKVKIKSLQLLHFDKSEEWLPKKGSRYFTNKNGVVKTKNKLSNRCFRMWSSCVVSWDGNVIPCCFDKNASYIMGNINSQGLREIWDSRKYKNFRQKVFSERKNIYICYNCIEGLSKKNL